MDDKEWSEGPENDPVELQKEQIKLGREFLERIKKQEAAEEARKKESAAPKSPAVGAIGAYVRPSFENVSAALKKAWDEVEKIMPAAGDRVKAMALQVLFSAGGNGPGFY